MSDEIIIQDDLTKIVFDAEGGTSVNLNSFDTNILTQGERGQLIRKNNAATQEEWFTLNSFFELKADNTIEYTCPLVLSGNQDFDFSFDYYLASSLSTQNIFDAGNSVGNNLMSVKISSSGKFQLNASNSAGTSSITVETSTNTDNRWYNIRLTKVGGLFSIYLNGTISDSDTLSGTIDFDSFDFFVLNIGEVGNKIKNLFGLYDFPTYSNLYKLYTDTSKTILAVNGNKVAVIETPDGDLVQSDSNYQATAFSVFHIGTVNAGTAGKIALYPSAGNILDDVYVQNSQNISIAIAAQASRSAGLTYTIPNPGNAETAATFAMATGISGGQKIIGGRGLAENLELQSTNHETRGLIDCLDPVIAQSPVVIETGTSRTLGLSDANKIIFCSNAGAISITIPTNATAAFATWARIEIMKAIGAGTITITATSGVTLNGVDGGSTTITLDTDVKLLFKVGTNAWYWK